MTWPNYRTLAVIAATYLAAIACAQVDYSVSSVQTVDPKGRPYTPMVLDGTYFLKANIAVTGTSPDPCKVRFKIADRVVEVTSSVPAAGVATAIAGIPCPLDGAIPYAVTLDPYNVTGDTNTANNKLLGNFTPGLPLTTIQYWGRRRLNASQSLTVKWTGGTVDHLVMWFGQPQSGTSQTVRSITAPTGSTVVSSTPNGYPLNRVEAFTVPIAGKTIQQSMVVDASNLVVNSTVLKGASWSPPPNLQQYLTAERTVQSDSDAVGTFVSTNLPANYQTNMNPFDAAKMLYQAVVRKLNYSETGAGDAVGALNGSTGDDTGFARLLVASLRRAGIPARTVTGWQENDIEGLAPRWRTWVEICFYPYGWVACDPSECDRLSPNGDYAYYFGIIPNGNKRVSVSYGNSFTYDALDVDQLQGGFAWYWGNATGATLTASCTVAELPNAYLPGFLGQTNGSIGIWKMKNNAVYSWKNLGNPGANAQIVTVGDFNGDGMTDMLGQYPNGDIATWLMNGSSTIQWTLLGSPGTGVRFCGAADFNGDGKEDLLGQYPNGDVAVWYMNGARTSGWVPIGNPGAHVIGVGDFNGDGKPDFLAQYPSGSLAIWCLANAKVISWKELGNPGPVSIVAVADFNNDGHADFIGWINGTHYLQIWYTNGQYVTQAKLLGDPGAGVVINTAGIFTQ